MDKKKELEEIARQVAQCQSCSLYKTANLSVPGEGDCESKLMFIGEGPGFNEDKQGRPFVGQAGRLLDEMLLSIGLKREEVFIGNVIKHRPPENRDPQPFEIEACGVWLDRQIEIIDPDVIITLGRFSMNKFLPGEFISHVHGQSRYVVFFGKKRIIIPMYHPAAALRNGNVLAELKKDFQKIIPFLGGKATEEKKEEGKEEINEQLGLL